MQFANANASPKQKDGYNCGCFTCMCADCLSLDLHLDFEQMHSDCFREQLFLKILENSDGSQFKPHASARPPGTGCHIDAPDHSVYRVQLVARCSTHCQAQMSSIMEPNDCHIKFSSPTVPEVTDGES